MAARRLRLLQRLTTDLTPWNDLEISRSPNYRWPYLFVYSTDLDDSKCVKKRGLSAIQRFLNRQNPIYIKKMGAIYSWAISRSDLEMSRTFLAYTVVYCSLRYKHIPISYSRSGKLSIIWFEKEHFLLSLLMSNF